MCVCVSLSLSEEGIGRGEDRRSCLPAQIQTLLASSSSAPRPPPFWAGWGLWILALSSTKEPLLYLSAILLHFLPLCSFISVLGRIFPPTTAAEMEGKSGNGGSFASFLLFLACVTVAAGIAGAATAPAPSPDCTAAISSMADCLGYVQAGSKLEKPEATCCSGLKKVVKTEASCLCDVLKNSADIGAALNLTKALSLPAACGVSSPSISKCKIADLGAAPAPAPGFFSLPSPAPSPSSAGGAHGIPAPAPMKAMAPLASAPSIAFFLAGAAIAAHLRF